MTNRLRAAATNAALLIASIVLSSLLLEIAFRLYSGVAVFEFPDWRERRVIAATMSSSSEYAPLLGWKIKDHLTSPTLNTLEYGIRKNQESDSSIRTGGVLAVGDSFTAGSEVMDWDSWPAQLETLLGEPVINAGVGGYGTDQILLRAEQLLPIVRPRVLVVGFLDQDILRASYSVFGRPKPYFTVERGSLVLHNNPVPRSIISESSSFFENHLTWLAALLSRSFVIDRLMTASYPDIWHAKAGQNYRRVGNDNVDVTCALLARVKQAADASSMRMLLMMQYGGPIRAAEAPPGYALMVEECAGRAGIQVVDEFATLKAIWRQDAKNFRKLYVVQPDGETLGHMSAAGNAQIAKLLTAAITRPPKLGEVKPAAARLPSSGRAGDGRNRIARSEHLDLIAVPQGFATISPAGTISKGINAFRLSAKGGPSEHYVVIALPADLPADAYTLSMWVRPDPAQRMRIQLLDGERNGGIADIDLASKSGGMTRIGRAFGLFTKIDPETDGWSRIQLSASLPGAKGMVLLQLSDATGGTNFRATGDGLLVGALQLEAGETPSSYTPGGEPR
jgi:hypothetical protein